MVNQFTQNLMTFLINYIKDRFSKETDFTTSEFVVSEAFDYNQHLSCPQIAIQILDNAENEQYTSFEAENVSDFGIQINIYAENMQIGENIYSAEKASMIIADELQAYMNDIKFKLYNTNIVRIVRIGKDYRSPEDDTGQVYVNVLRFDCQTVYPYNTELENYKGE